MQYPALRWNLCDFHDHDEVEERDSESTWSDAEGFLSETDSLSTLTSCTCRYILFTTTTSNLKFFYNMKSMLQSTDIQNSLKFTRYICRPYDDEYDILLSD